MKRFTITLINNSNWNGKVITLYGSDLAEALKYDGWGDGVFSIISDVKTEEI